MSFQITRGVRLGAASAAVAIAWLLWKGSAHLLASEGLVCADFTNSEWATAPAATRIERDPAAPLLGTRFALTHEHFSTRCDGWLFADVDAQASVTFVLVSDDGSDLFIDGERIVDNRGRHGYTPAVGAATLMPGPHAVAIRYSQEGGQYGFGLVWGAEGQPLGPLLRDDVSQRPLTRTEHRLRPFARIARIIAFLLTATAIAFGLWNTPAGRAVRAAGRQLIAVQDAVVSQP